MKNFTRVLFGLLCFYFIPLNSQNNGEGIVLNYANNKIENNLEQIKKLEASKKKVEELEKKLLKINIEKINEQLDNKEITKEEADKLKKDIAKTRALNIQNKIAIIDNEIELLKRNHNGYRIDEWKDPVNFQLGVVETDDGGLSLGFKLPKSKKRISRRGQKKDIRTRSGFVYAFGLNNVIIDGVSLDDTLFELGGSRFFEFGYNWRTRVFKNTNFVRFNYGLSFQINGLRQKEDVIFVEDGDVTRLESFPVNLRKSKLSNSNLVFPIHFEFGPSFKRIRGKNQDIVRYYTYSKFKVGIGGYAGFNIGTRQKLRFRDEAGNRVKEKIRGDFNTTDFVYGLSAYIGLGGWGIYAKYDLSPIFRNQTIDQNNISLGIRLDFAR